MTDDATNWHPKRVVILEFPEIASLNKSRDSDDYKPVADLRHKAVTKESFVVIRYGDANN